MISVNSKLIQTPKKPYNGISNMFKLRFKLRFMTVTYVMYLCLLKLIIVLVSKIL